VTELIYHTDGYCKQFEARLLKAEVESRAVALDRTAFYPGGGGQPPDAGTLVIQGITYPVDKVFRRGDEIWHALSADPSGLNIGTPVQGNIDWERRYLLMRTHTALHVLCGVIFRDFAALVTGADMEPGKGRMDFEFERLQRELVQVIERAVNVEVESGRDVCIKTLPREEAFQIPDLIRTKINLLPEGIMQIRTVEIVGLDLQADGGTHVGNTSEVGHVRVVDYKSKGAINKRIYIELE